MSLFLLILCFRRREIGAFFRPLGVVLLRKNKQIREIIEDIRVFVWKYWEKDPIYDMDNSLLMQGQGLTQKASRRTKKGSIIMNVDCKKPISSKNERNIDKNHANHGIGFYIAIFIVFTIPPIIIGLAMNNSAKPPVYSISGRTFSISTEFGQKVNLSDIKSVQLKDSLPKIGSKSNGLGLGTVLKGKFSSNIGNISLYVNTAIPQFIYIETTSGLIILNDQSVAKTQALYNELSMDINNNING